MVFLGEMIVKTPFTSVVYLRALYQVKDLYITAWKSRTISERGSRPVLRRIPGFAWRD
jgi:hypothetical protein